MFNAMRVTSGANGSHELMATAHSDLMTNAFSIMVLALFASALLATIANMAS